MPKPRKVCLIGCHVDEDVLPEGYEVWAVNNCWKGLSRYDRLYELHRPQDRPWRPAAHWKHLRAPTGQLWTMYEDLKRWPRAQLYPVQQVLYRFRPYFTNSFCWMIAHALIEGVTDLALYGVNLADPHERHFERPATEYWLGMAEGMGVKLLLEPKQPLLKATFLYALDDTRTAHAQYYAYTPSPADRADDDYLRYLLTGQYTPRKGER